MVTRGSSFEQTMMGWSPKCYIPSFVEFCPPVPEKKIFEGFLPYTRGDQKVRGKVLLNRIAFIDCNENS